MAPEGPTFHKGFLPSIRGLIIQSKKAFGMSLKMINRREDLIDRKQRAKHELTVLSDFLPMMR